MVEPMSRPPVPVAFSDVHLLMDTAEEPAEAVEIRRLVAERHLPLVLCSTKTRAELECLQQEFGIRHPFVCENGAAVYVPDKYFGFPVAVALRGYEVVRFGAPYAEVVDGLHRTARRLGITVVGFNDLSIEDVAMECRLTLPQARLAKMREFGEPFRIDRHHAHERPRLFNALRKQGLGCTRGGQYDYVGAPVDEVAGINLLCRCYERTFGSIVSIGVGDPVRDGRLLSRMQNRVIRPSSAGTGEYIRKPQTAEFDVPSPGRWRVLFRSLLESR